METTLSILTLIAIISGPIVAVQLEKFLQRKRDNNERKHYLFKTLMSTRGSNLSIAHVEALNRIDLEFYGSKKHKKVIDAWKEYFDNLGQKFETEEDYKIWNSKNEELFTNMLFEMGLSLGYNFDKVLIKRHKYSPIAHFKIERENEIIREKLIKLLHGDFQLPINISRIEIDDESLLKQKELQSLMIEYYKQNTEKITETNIHD